MAMSYHMEARIKQERLNRWNEQKRRGEKEPLALDQALTERPEDAAYKQKMDKILITDPGQFHQVSLGQAMFSKHSNALNLPPDRVRPLLHPIDQNFKIPLENLPKRKPHFKV